MKSILKSFGSNKLIFILIFGYILFVSIYMISHRIWFSPDQFFVFVLFGMLLIGRAKMFIQDWVPFLILYSYYEFFRGLVPFVSKNVHIFPMIRIDEKIFGFIPTVQLQSALYNPNHLMWYDYVLVTLYICHFVTPMIVGFYFWFKDRDFFRKYTLGILAVSYAAFTTFLLYPAMPPWMASNNGYIPQIKEVTGVVMSHFLKTSVTLPSLFSLFGGDPVAAMPSLHAAFPTLMFLFIYKWNKKLGFIFFPYVLGVWFAVMYLGEHYFIDVAMGAIYALVTFLIVDYLRPNEKIKVSAARATAS